MFFLAAAFFLWTIYCSMVLIASVSSALSCTSEHTLGLLTSAFLKSPRICSASSTVISCVDVSRAHLKKVSCEIPIIFAAFFDESLPSSHAALNCSNSFGRGFEDVQNGRLVFSGNHAFYDALLLDRSIQVFYLVYSNLNAFSKSDRIGHLLFSFASPPVNSVCDSKIAVCISAFELLSLERFAVYSDRECICSDSKLDKAEDWRVLAVRKINSEFQLCKFFGYFIEQRRML